MNWLDAAFIVIIAWFTIAAFFAGVIREAVTLAAAITAIVLAGLYYDDLAQDMSLVIENSALANVASFAIIFGAVALGGQLAAFLLKQAVSILMLGWADHALGALLGLIKGALLVELFLIVVTTYPAFELDSIISNSTLAPFFLKGVPTLLRLLPSEFNHAIESTLL